MHQTPPPDVLPGGAGLSEHPQQLEKLRRGQADGHQPAQFQKITSTDP
jgi:hypothetical protein